MISKNEIEKNKSINNNLKILNEVLKILKEIDPLHFIRFGLSEKKYYLVVLALLSYNNLSEEKVLETFNSNFWKKCISSNTAKEIALRINSIKKECLNE